MEKEQLDWELLRREAHQKILSISQTLKPDYYLYTDGSGHQDGYGATGSIAVEAIGDWGVTNISASTGTTVERQETNAMLDGLQAIYDHFKAQNLGPNPALRKIPTVFWVTDRESTALCVWRNERGEPFYRRKSVQDLWARFEWYEKRIQVLPIFNRRKTHPIQDITDKLASDTRLSFKDWIFYLINEKEIPYAK